MTRTTRVITGRTYFVSVLLILAVALPAGAVMAQSIEFVGSDTCADCHDDIAASFTRNVHGRIAETWADQAFGGCEWCHGAGGAHVDSQDTADIRNLSSDTGEEASTMCVGCHDNGPFLDWHTGQHASADIGCTSCHTVHAEMPADNLLVADTVSLCTSCHTEQKTQFMMPSHHPLREGFMDCADCHNPHSGAYQGITALEQDRELCLSCHQQHAGPFIFDHSPVEEDCGLCHNPHGAVANNLLVQNEPFLCLQCHQPHFHSGLYASDDPYSTANWPADGDGDEVDDGIPDDYPIAYDLEGHSTQDGFKRSMLTKCTQCHAAVHGTDLPSQGISGGGRALVR